ncbi:MAG: hypothetical protein FJX37_06470, partial [Alphaproteobacteria bacterium]|nr:hypothetical protein [Alphaproteobacteria bacterium]
MNKAAMDENPAIPPIGHFFRPRPSAVLRGLVLMVMGFTACSWGGSAAAQTVTPELPRAYSSAGFAREAPVAPDVLRIVFPGATRVGEFSGTPPAAIAFENEAPIGYVFSTRAVIGSVGFSGKPLDVLAGLGNDGLIRGAVLRRHSEPILVIGIPEEQLNRYVAALAGL